jgi:hypothetical protein
VLPPAVTTVVLPVVVVALVLGVEDGETVALTVAAVAVIDDAGQTVCSQVLAAEVKIAGTMQLIQLHMMRD